MRPRTAASTTSARFANASRSSRPRARYKVYILDEAHSLTPDASNALLKTLEEPPPHVVFVLCTTDPAKLLSTIRSRCQRFAFRRPGPGELVKVLSRVCEAEGIEAPDAVLHLVARAGAGSYRDALTILDQLSTASDGPIAVEDAVRLLGLVPEQALVDLVDLVAQGEPGELLRRIDALAESGQDMHGLLDSLLGHLRLIYLLQHAEVLPESEAAAPDRMRRAAAAGPVAAPVRDAAHDRPARHGAARHPRRLRRPPAARGRPDHGRPARGERRAGRAAGARRAARARSDGRRRRRRPLPAPAPAAAAPAAASAPAAGPARARSRERSASPTARRARGSEPEPQSGRDRGASGPRRRERRLERGPRTAHGPRARRALGLAADRRRGLERRRRGLRAAALELAALRRAARRRDRNGARPAAGAALRRRRTGPMEAPTDGDGTISEVELLEQLRRRLDATEEAG